MLQCLSRTAVAVTLCVGSASLPAQPVAVEAQPTLADPASVPAPTPPVPEQPAVLRLAALVPIELIVLDEITSKTAINGAPVRLALARPLYVTSELGLPEGTPVEGIVIHAAKGGMGGKSGELLLGARRIILSDSVTIPLRSFKLAPARGKNNETLAFGAAVAGGAIGGVAAMLITGGSAKVPAGTSAIAKTSADTEIPATLLSPLPLLPAQSVTPPAASSPAPPAPPVPTAIAQPPVTKGDMK